MNWETYLVQGHELQALISHNQPIEVSNGNLVANAGVELYTLTGNRYNAIYDAELKAVRKLNTNNPQFHDMQNRDLVLYNDHLLNDNVNTIIVDGLFGTGKTSTVCSHLVDGMVKELEDKQGGIPIAYISKPHVGVGNGYGHLPGDLQEKTAEEFKSYTQYFNRFGNPGLADFLMMRNVEEQSKFNKQRSQQLAEPMLEVMPFEYLRGRDIEKGWIVLDETQNTDQKEISTFLSRIGDKAKLITIGDTTSTQIDRKGNTPESNGLTFTKETYIGKKYAGYVELNTIKHILRGERVRDLYRKLKG
jgi:PhoH-like ATPase